MLQMDSDYHWLVTVTLVTSSIIALTANVLLLLIFTKKRSLRTIPNRFVINLLLTNLLSSLLLIPLLIVDQRSITSSSSSRTSLLESNNSFRSFEEDLLVKEEEFFSHNKSVKIIKTSEEILKRTTSSVNIETTTNSTTNSIIIVQEEILCYFAQASTSFICTASIFSILLIGINQYFGVIHSLRYHFYVNKFRASIFIMSSWFAALIFAVLSTLTYSDGGLWNFCAKRDSIAAENSIISKTVNTVYAFSYFFIVILAPFLSICIIYVCIYTAARQNSERMRKSTSACSTTPLDSLDVDVDESSSSSSSSNNNKERKIGLPKVHSAPNFSAAFPPTVDEPSTIIPARVKRTNSDRNNFIINLKHKISNVSVFRYREETRAAKISVLVILMVLVCYVPYGLTLILSSGCININSGKVFNYLSLVLLVFSNVLSPFLFGYRNKRVKREIGRLLGLVPSSSSASSANNVENEYYNNKRSSLTHHQHINRSVDDGLDNATIEICDKPLLNSDGTISISNNNDTTVPNLIVSCKLENERKSILKRVGSGWSNYKKCNFITVPDSCLSDARGSFSSASTQVSNDDF